MMASHNHRDTTPTPTIDFATIKQRQQQTWSSGDYPAVGATIQDMKDLFQHMAEGDSFWIAFERVLGISVSYLEENFFTLMEAYLS